MHAGPLITTPSALLLFSLSPLVSPVLSSSFIVSCLHLFPSCILSLISRFVSFSLPLRHYIFLSFLLFIFRSVVNILSCAQTPA